MTQESANRIIQQRIDAGENLPYRACLDPLRFLEEEAYNESVDREAERRFGPWESEPTSAPTLEAPWPTIADEAFHGLAGELVELYDPYTEADRCAVLFCLLAQFGVYFGNRASVYGGNVDHPAKIWPLVTGKSSSGAKGTAIAVAKDIMDKVDPDFWIRHKASGLSTSEGLIRAVRDPKGKPDDKDFDEGVSDKRLLVVETEFVNVLERSRRQGNGVSATIRDAYDGFPMQTLVSGNPLLSTGHHIGIIGAITPSELVQKMSATDIKNGFANRFMVVCSRRSKDLPNGAEPPRDALSRLAQRVRQARNIAEKAGRMERTPAAAELWAEEYKARNNRDLPPGPAEDLFARWAPHSARLSVAYALLDHSTKIEVEHVRAARAAWDYVEASTRYVFSSPAADPKLGTLMEFVDGGGVDGRSRKEISEVLFKRNLPKAELDALCAKLLSLPGYETSKRFPPGGAGRPAAVYRRKRGEAA